MPKRPSPLPLTRAGVALLVCLMLSAVGVAPTIRAAGSKKRDPVIAVRFHSQVYAFDPTFTAKVKIGNPPQEIIVEKLPSLSERDIAGFYPYRAADGSYSAVFQFDRHGSAVLESLSAQKRGMVLVAAVNGRPITTLTVDKTITDGIIFIPFGLTLADIHALGASFSIMGETDADKDAKKQPKEPAFTDPTLPVETPKPRSGTGG